jgi:beta-fructofuranosidase
MGALVIGVACAGLLLLQLTRASHVVYNHKEFEAQATTVKVPPSIINPS